MSEAKPPSQTTVGPSPSIRRQAISAPSGQPRRPLLSPMAKLLFSQPSAAICGIAANCLARTQGTTVTEGMALPSRILVIKLGPVGDFVLSLAAMKKIREAHRGSHITLLTTPQFESLAKACPY